MPTSAISTNGTLEYIPVPLLPEVDRRENGILYTNTKIGNSQLSTARSGFDAGRFKGMQVRDRRYPVVDSETGAVMSLVRFGNPMGPLSKASLPFDRQGKPQQAPDIMVGGVVRQRDLRGVAGEDRGDPCVLDSQ